MPPRPHRLALPARQDLRDITRYYAIEKASPSAAEKVLQAIRAACKRAGEDPQTGRGRPEIGAEVRSKLVRGYPYIIFFRAAPPDSGYRVQILRVVHQRRNVDPSNLEDD